MATQTNGSNAKELPRHVAENSLYREIIFLFTLAMNISGAAVQSTAERISITQVNLNNFHAELVHLFGLINL